MIYFSFNQVQKIHTALIKETGGIDGIRDTGLLDSSLQAIFQNFSGHNLYPSIADKVSQLSYSIIKNHPFLDGNKRIGVHLMLLFLQLNKINIVYTQEQLINLGLGIASGNLGKEDIKNWISKGYYKC